MSLIPQPIANSWTSLDWLIVFLGKVTGNRNSRYSTELVWQTSWGPRPGRTEGRRVYYSTKEGVKMQEAKWGEEPKEPGQDWGQDKMGLRRHWRWGEAKGEDGGRRAVLLPLLLPLLSCFSCAFHIAETGGEHTLQWTCCRPRRSPSPCLSTKAVLRTKPEGPSHHLLTPLFLSFFLPWFGKVSILCN